MRILLVNPNISRSVSDRIRQSAEDVAAPGTELEVVTASFGSAIIASQCENVIGAHAALTSFVEATADRTFDAGIVAAFTDAGLTAIREIMPFPVVGLVEASMKAAAADGRRFAVLMPTPAMNPMIIEFAQRYGVSDQFVGVFTLAEGTVNLTGDMDAIVPSFTTLTAQAVAAGAEAVILGGALMAHLRSALQELVDVPVYEGVSCAVRTLQAGTGMRPVARRTLFNAGMTKPAKGISPELAHRLGLRLDERP